MTRFATLAFMLSFVTGCATGSYVLVGEVREPTAPESVKLYLEPPPSYEAIGIVEASMEIGFSAQAAQDAAIAELKEQAAKIGANGIILTATGVKTGDAVGTVVGNTVIASSSEYKTATGTAIFVIEE